MKSICLYRVYNRIHYLSEVPQKKVYRMIISASTSLLDIRTYMFNTITFCEVARNLSKNTNNSTRLKWYRDTGCGWNEKQTLFVSECLFEDVYIMWLLTALWTLCLRYSLCVPAYLNEIHSVISSLPSLWRDVILHLECTGVILLMYVVWYL